MDSLRVAVATNPLKITRLHRQRSNLRRLQVRQEEKREERRGESIPATLCNVRKCDSKQQVGEEKRAERGTRREAIVWWWCAVCVFVCVLRAVWTVFSFLIYSFRPATTSFLFVPSFLSYLSFLPSFFPSFTPPPSSCPSLFRSKTCLPCLPFTTLPAAHCRSLPSTPSKATLQRVADVRRAVGHVQRMVEDGDFNGALDIIHTTQDVLATELAGVQSLRLLGRQLLGYRDLIRETMTARLEDIAVRWDLSADGQSITDADAQLSLLAPLVTGLLRLGQLGPALGRYRSRMRKEIKTVLVTLVASSLEEYSDIDEGEGGDANHSNGNGAGTAGGGQVGPPQGP